MKTAADQKNVSVYKVIKSFTPYLFKENKKVTFFYNACNAADDGFDGWTDNSNGEFVYIR